MKALTLIQQCAREYNDVAYGRIKKASATEVNWLDWLNEAQRVIALVRADSSAVTENITLAAGAKQSIPAGRTRILSVSRNMGADGTTVGRAIRIVPREDQDAVNEDWYAATPASPVREVLYDDKKDPLTFWVKPPAVANWKIEATLSRVPAEIALADVDTADISLGDIYGSPMHHWMMYRAMLVNVQAVGNVQRAAGYFQSFFNLLGVKLQAELWAAALGSPQLPRQRQQA